MKNDLPLNTSFDLLDFLPLGVFVLNSELTVLFWNACLEEWTHISRQEIVGQTIDSYFPHLLQPNYFNRLNQVFEGGHSILFSSQLHPHLISIERADGQLQVQHTTVTARPGHQAGEFYALWSIQDVTDLSNQVQRHKAEQIKVRRSEEALARELLRTKALFNTSLDGVVVVDQAGNVVQASPSFCRMIGYTVEQTQGLNMADWDARFTSQELQQMRECLNPPPLFETCHRRQDGSLYDVEISYTRLQLEGEVMHLCICRDISDRKRTELELRQSEARFQAFMNHSPTAAWITDAEGKLLYLSQTYFRTFQVPPGNFIGQSIFDLFPPEVAQPLFENIQTVVQTQQCLERIEVAPCPDGSLANFLVYKFPIPDASGQLLVGGVAIDVTQQQQVEDALRQSEATQQAIIQSIPDLLVRTRADGSHIELISQSQFNLLQADDYQRGLGIYDVLPPSLAQLRMHYIQQAVQTNTVQLYEQDLLNEGVQRSEEVRIVPLNPEEVLVMVRDITDRRQAEADLRHQKEMFQVIVDHIPVMITLFNTQGEIEFINPEVERVLGWSLADWQDRNILADCYPDPAYRQAVLDDMLAATGHWKDWTMWNAQGQSLEATWANVRLSGGWFMGIGQDISDRKQKEVALRHAMESAEAANLAKSMFLANMSHELRTPLNVMLGFAQVMGHDHSLTPSQQHDLQTIRRSGDHLLRLINDVLDLSKIEAGHYGLEEAGFDLISLLHTLRTMMTERANVKQVQLAFDIMPDIPQFIIADEQKLRQILLNLLSNAIKFTHQGVVTLRVTRQDGPGTAWAAPPPGDHSELLTSTPTCLLKFEVIDTGVGIIAREQDTIFDAFVQAEAGRKSISGTGLGLTISRKLVELMHGKIAVHSVPEVGSTFTVTLPVCSTSGVTIPPVQGERTVVGLLPGQPSRRILVVDDQRENRLLMVRLLTQLNLEVREAGNGQEAIRLWQTWHPDLIWMDIRMPGMDGYEATHQIRAMERVQTTTIIALTAQASHSDRTLALAAGCNDYISKPFQEATIFLKMSEHLGLQYLYTESSSEAIPAPPESTLTTQSSPGLSESAAFPWPALSSLSPVWLQALEEAAICGNDRTVITLADQLTPEFAPFAAYLIDRADQFQFEQILTLLHQQLSSRQ